MPLLIAIFVGLSLAGYFSLFPARFCDFRAFYCSGQGILAGQDPYREHPLHECEQTLPGHFLSSIPAELTIPAPYPGYVLALFSLVARLPFDVAVIAWTASSCLALSAAIVLVARVTSTSLYAAAIALGFPAFIIPLVLGQPTLFVLCAIAGCGALLGRQKPRLAALAALGSAIDPHVGLALCFALFVGVPRTRATLVAGSVALAASSAVAFGPAREWEYIAAVLPLHALVNVPEFSQFSTASLAFTAGVPAPTALMLGNLWYAASLILGVVAGLRLRSRLGMAALAFVPVAFAVFGGTHTHFQQLGLAMPAFLLASSAAAGRRRALLVAATFVACVPWLIAAPFPYLYVAVAILGMAFARVMGTARTSVALGASCFVVLALLCCAIVYTHTGAVAVLQATPSGNPLAEESWGAYVRATSLPAPGWYLAAKLPTIFAFLTMLSVLLYEAWPKSKRTALAPAALAAHPEAASA